MWSTFTRALSINSHVPTNHPSSQKTLDGKTFVFAVAEDAGCFMNCFFNTLTCEKCCGPATMIQHVKEKNGALDIWGGEARICGGCAPMSPCPCCVYCGVGPCAAEWHFKSIDGKADEYTATGSAFKGGCCEMCTNHNGDRFTFNADFDGSVEKPMYMIAGMNPMNPPCLAGKRVLKFYEVTGRRGKPAVAPSQEVISRD